MWASISINNINYGRRMRPCLSQVIKLASQLSKYDKGDNQFNQSSTTCFDVHGTPVNKFISNHAIRILKGIKNMKIHPWKKTRKPMTYNKGHFDTIQSEAPQLVS